MDVPSGFSPSSTEGEVCRLKKALYMLTQSPRAWFNRFLKTMVKFGYRQSDAYHKMLVKRADEKITILVVYVNDIVVTSDDPYKVSSLKAHMAREFDTKGLGPLRSFLGLSCPVKLQYIYLQMEVYSRC